MARLLEIVHNDTPNILVQITSFTVMLAVIILKRHSSSRLSLQETTYGNTGLEGPKNKVSMIGDRRGIVYVQFLMHSHSLTINAVRA
jgi:hypothetical protein